MDMSTDTTMTPPSLAATLPRAALLERRLADDPEDNGKFIVGVRTTGIYCLPSCHPPRRAKPENIDFYATPEEARAAGLRACKLCRPDDFYLGQHTEESLIEGLVAGLTLDPGASQRQHVGGGRRRQPASCTSCRAPTTTRRPPTCWRGRAWPAPAACCCMVNVRWLRSPSRSASRA